MSADRDAILTAQYVALTTFRRDGTPVTTPVWAGVEGDRLYIFSNPHVGKVKRIRNSPRVTVAPCSMRGVITAAALPGEAVLLPPDQMPQVWRLLVKKYGIAARLFAIYDRLRAALGMTVSAGIEIRFN
jgi:PPOX class probable F420-dependent enzyme